MPAPEAITIAKANLELEDLVHASIALRLTEEFFASQPNDPFVQKHLPGIQAAQRAFTGILTEIMGPPDTQLH